MTIEQAKRDFNQMVIKNGFTEAGYTRDINRIIYHREWREDDATLEVRMMFSGTYTLVSVKHNGKADPKFIRDYSSPKRAMSAIRTDVYKRQLLDCKREKQKIYAQKVQNH